MTFIDSFISFLDATAREYERDGYSFYFRSKDITFRAVPLSEELQIPDPTKSQPQLQPQPQSKTIYIFEDRWWREGEVIKQRLLAHLGEFRSIFARKCVVKQISAVEASPFLKKYHSYGTTRCKYRYGMYYQGELVAVSTFSAPRKMTRNIGEKIVELDSYEWVRYASLPDCRICGGMGKMLHKFVEEIHPQEVMSYADREWSDGEAYKKLGFKRVETKPPIEFYINTTTWERISAKKLKNDRAYQNIDPSSQSFVKIHNLGSQKYLKLL